jgi:hypothetical protein
VIKDLMNSVFGNMVREFGMDGRLTGAEVADQLGQLLKRQSGRTFMARNERGLKVCALLSSSIKRAKQNNITRCIDPQTRFAVSRLK